MLTGEWVRRAWHEVSEEVTASRGFYGEGRNYMKFLAVFLLTLSLVATSSFAVSLNPPLVLSMQEYEGTMTSDDFDYNERSEADFSFFKPFVGVISFMLVIFGFSWGVMGAAELKDGGDKGGAMLGGGLGITALGALGMYWAF